MTKFFEQMVTSNINTIVKSLSDDVLAMQATTPFADGQSQSVVDALRIASTISLSVLRF